jgi:3',5'-cyclic AMP phosphodiesterase CpdA
MVVQLGDLGTGPTSGCLAAFEAARTFLLSLNLPFLLITGNHDLEGTAYDTDAANLEAWSSCFEQNHYWAKDVGPCVLVGLSTTRYRSNVLSHHEVHVDATQVDWFEALLQTFEVSKPVVVFTHAPPLGCGLKVINDLHIKNRCVVLGWSPSS